MKFLMALVFTLTIFAFSTQVDAVNGHYAKISDDVSLFYKEVGSGNVLIFLPGWTEVGQKIRTKILKN